MPEYRWRLVRDGLWQLTRRRSARRWSVVGEVRRLTRRLWVASDSDGRELPILRATPREAAEVLTASIGAAAVSGPADNLQK